LCSSSYFCHWLILGLFQSLYSSRMFDDSDEFDMDSADEAVEQVAVKAVKKVVGARHMQQMREVLDLDKFQRKKEAKIRKRKARKARMKLEGGGEAIQTLASRKLGDPQVEVVHYTDYRRLKPGAKPVKEEQKEHVEAEEDRRKEVTMDQARFDVFKLGVSGLDKATREEVQTNLAIRLGAKPEKRKGVPLEELKETRRTEQEMEREKLEEQKNSMAGVRKKTQGSKEKVTGNKTKSKKKSSSGMKVGSFDGGMLKISAKELSRVKGKK